MIFRLSELTVFTKFVHTNNNNLLFFDSSEGDHKDKKHGYPSVPTDIYGHYCYIFMAIVRDYN